MHGSQMIYATVLMILVAMPGTKEPVCVVDATLTALFTPPHPRLGRYDVCTTPQSPDELVAEGAEPDTPEGVHYGAVEALEALEAFGSAGPYDRSRLARLYGGTRVRVVRGWRTDSTRFESLTLLSPYPDRSLRHLVAGTMVIRFTVNRAEPHAR